MSKLAEYEDAEPTMSGEAKADGGDNAISSDVSFEEAIARALGGS